MKYRVHQYRVVRHPVEVEAESQEAAIEAAELVPLDLSKCDSVTCIGEGYVVDELNVAGEVNYDTVGYYDAEGKRL